MFLGLFPSFTTGAHYIVSDGLTQRMSSRLCGSRPDSELAEKVCMAVCWAGPHSLTVPCPGNGKAVTLSPPSGIPPSRRHLSWTGKKPPLSSGEEENIWDSSLVRTQFRSVKNPFSHALPSCFIRKFVFFYVSTYIKGFIFFLLILSVLLLSVCILSVFTMCLQRK